MENYKSLLKIDIQKEFDKNKGKVLNKKPREHQEIAFTKMSSFFSDKGKRGMLVLPTGAGKTYTAVYWLLKNIIAKKGKILWIADQGFLLEQARDEIKENVLLLNPTIKPELKIILASGSSNHANTNEIQNDIDIVLTTAQTLISSWNTTDDSNRKTKLKKFIENAGDNDNLFIVYDEAHHTPAFERRNLLIGGSEGKTGIFEKYPKTQLLGLTATPTYTDKNKRGWLWEIFKDGIIYEVSKKELQDKKILAFPNFRQERTNFSFVMSDKEIENIALKHQEIPYKIINEIAKNEDRNRYLSKYYWDNHKEFGKTLIFVDRWYQCEMIEKYINKLAGKKIAGSIFSYIDGNKNSEYINSRTKNINDINLDKFKKGELQVLLNVRMLTEGVDVPDVKTVFITRDTNSRILFTQMVGRALRGEKAGGKKDTANIILFTDNWNKHIEFASSQYNGKLDEKQNIRGHKPYQLINVSILDNLELAYHQKNYKTHFINMLPVGWFVVEYSDTIAEEIEEGKIHKTTERFIENVIVLENEKKPLDEFIKNFEKLHKSTKWEMEELPEETEKDLNQWLDKYFPNIDKVHINSVKTKLRQIARHLGQNRGIYPEYYTFEQRKELDIMKYVLEAVKNKYSREQEEAFLEEIYKNNNNPFFKLIFKDYESFYKAYNYEYEVFRKQKKEKVIIEGEYVKNDNVERSVTKVREFVLARDGHKCLCCGKKNRLEMDHIIPFKYEMPNSDNPELIQTLCHTCNNEKGTNDFNYRITDYNIDKIKVRNVKSSSAKENPVYYLNRLINAYFATNAVQQEFTKAKNNGNSIWKVKLKPSVNNIDILKIINKDKNKLIDILKEKGYRFKKLEIEI